MSALLRNAISSGPSFRLCLLVPATAPGNRALNETRLPYTKEGVPGFGRGRENGGILSDGREV